LAHGAYRIRNRRFIDVLQKSNVGDYIELPQISVMGDTSSGKSSLLTAVSGIEFPSSDKLTTRCPARPRLEKNATEKTKVSIKWTGEEKEGWGTKTLLNTDMEGIKEAIRSDHFLARPWRHADTERDRSLPSL
jgi:predicted GTPase